MVHSSAIVVTRGDRTICKATANIHEDSDKWVSACSGNVGSISVQVQKFTYNKVNMFSSRTDEIKWNVVIKCSKCGSSHTKTYGNTGFSNDDYDYYFDCKCCIITAVSMKFDSALGSLVDSAKEKADILSKKYNKCGTSFHTKFNCEGRASDCVHCHQPYCVYHVKAVGNAVTDLKGGHVCPEFSKGGKVVEALAAGVKVAAVVGATVATGGGALAAVGAVATVGTVNAVVTNIECNTAACTKVNCSGVSKSCSTCKEAYCSYHFKIVDDVGTVSGGHVCKTTKGAALGKATEFIQDAVLVAGVATAGASAASKASEAGSKLAVAAHGANAAAKAKGTIDGSVAVAKKLAK